MLSYRRIFQPLASTQDTGHSSCARECPRCNSSVFRVSRRFIDMLISMFITIHRYRCISMQCNWEGNLREKQNDLPSCSLGVLSREQAGTRSVMEKSPRLVPR